MLAVNGAVNGFTLDMSIGEFVMTHQNVKVPQRGAYYSANEGRSESWDDATIAYSRPLTFSADMVLIYIIVYGDDHLIHRQVREGRKMWRFLWQSFVASLHRYHGW